MPNSTFPASPFSTLVFQRPISPSPVSTTSSLSSWGLYLQLRRLLPAANSSASSLADSGLEVNERSVNEAYGPEPLLDVEFFELV
ncbi:hypothetical protein GALMADRAFT_253247 [Galerina marginata CBS 339.88]|uniref:Uncharacterized protein n=1 Tax=Galerina marginata (strain CBS 339.88) TaxID=685588 RepID=A0A067SWC6_GALM3|nr:hypothetical protein GALMADRAFT_253247 [Galerina marginata CBS 339.88]